jgi:hypothetical protein
MRKTRNETEKIVLRGFFLQFLTPRFSFYGSIEVL